MLSALSLGRAAAARSSLAPILGRGASAFAASSRSVAPSTRRCLSDISAPVPPGPVAAELAAAATAACSRLRAAIVPARLSLLVDEVLASLLSPAWYIKRTFQPSLVKKRRRHGFLRRQESVGGRRVLKRRMARGRKRMGGS